MKKLCDLYVIGSSILNTMKLKSNIGFLDSDSKK